MTSDSREDSYNIAKDDGSLDLRVILSNLQVQRWAGDIIEQNVIAAPITAGCDLISSARHEITKGRGADRRHGDVVVDVFESQGQGLEWQDHALVDDLRSASRPLGQSMANDRCNM